jgi:DNA replication initiation complex subunit (GINS family)
MITDIQRRNQILRRINRIPKDKLKELEEYISKLEHAVGRNNKTLSFAGAWKDIDESVFDDFTEKLIRNRQKNRPRIDE